MSKKKLYCSIILNMFTLITAICCGINIFIKNPSNYKMFTVQSNVISGVVALVLVIYEILIIVKKKEELPSWLCVIKMISTTGVFLTLTVVVFYLGFVAVSYGYSYFVMFTGNNFFFHLFTPLSAIISFIFFESNNSIKFKLTFLNLIHMIIYSFFYAINLFTHLNPDGSVSRDYDWYYFVLGETYTFIFVVLGIITLTYGLGFLLWFFNKKISNINLLK